MSDASDARDSPDLLEDSSVLENDDTVQSGVPNEEENSFMMSLLERVEVLEQELGELKRNGGCSTSAVSASSGAMMEVKVSSSQDATNARTLQQAINVSIWYTRFTMRSDNCRCICMHS